MALGVTLSSDGTTHKHLNYTAHHISVNNIASDGKSSSTKFFLGIKQSINHTSQTQLKDWQSIISGLLSAYNSSPCYSEFKATIAWFTSLIRGMMTDHAEDQKKLVSLIKDWIHLAGLEQRGEEFLLSLPPIETMAILVEETQQKLIQFGGLAAWNMLPEEEQIEADKALYKNICIRYGKERYAALSLEERKSLEFFAWAGCSMHKELNAAKGGNTKMMAYWKSTGVTGPLKLLNKDNAAAAALSSSEAREHAIDASQGGAVKLTSLAGAVFHHKHDKKGQQDSFRLFFLKELGFEVLFPDTSNTRYQSHLQAAGVVVLYYELMIKFLEQVRDKKRPAGLNHLEQNIYNALHDIPTLTELCVLCLYCQSISAPYMRVVRSKDSDNALNLGPLHEKVKSHCQLIVSSPELLVGPTATYKTGSMDKQEWDSSEAFAKVQTLAPKLPHLIPALVEFFKGALDTWIRFSQEFATGGVIDQSTVEQRALAFMPTTNDDNEGALGSLRVIMRLKPGMTLHQYNARQMFKLNKTAAFAESLGPDMFKFARKESRKQDTAGLATKQKIEQANYDLQVAQEQQKANEEKRQKLALLNARLDEIEQSLRLDVQDIRANPGSNDSLDDQLRWHRNWHQKMKLEPAFPTVSSLNNKARKIEALVAAVTRYLEHCSKTVSTHKTNGIDECNHDSNESDSEDNT
jgi:hypothetical protein